LARLVLLVIAHNGASSLPAFAQQKYPARGLVLGVDKQHRIMTVSCETIPGYMDAMIMPIEVHETKELDGLGRGALIEFSLVVGKENS
jgi:Cu/Ag efflux protein CusF